MIVQSKATFYCSPSREIRQDLWFVGTSSFVARGFCGQRIELSIPCAGIMTGRGAADGAFEFERYVTQKFEFSNLQTSNVSGTKRLRSKVFRPGRTAQVELPVVLFLLRLTCEGPATRPQAPD
jgi:hypothetical protein